MTEIFPGNNAFKIKALAAYQIIFGLLGIWFTVQFIITQLNAPVFLSIDMVFVILYSYSIYCGIILFKNQYSGLTHSLISQYLQLVFISVAGFGFRYVSGIFILFGFDLTDSFVVRLNLGVSTWNVQISTHSNELFVGCNLVALMLIIFINKLKNKIAAEQEMNALAIGEEI
jgi:hypothetical protein